MHSMAVSIGQRTQGVDPHAQQAARLIADGVTSVEEVRRVLGFM